MSRCLASTPLRRALAEPRVVAADVGPARHGRRVRSGRLGAGAEAAYARSMRWRPAIEALVLATLAVALVGALAKHHGVGALEWAAGLALAGLLAAAALRRSLRV